MMDEEEFDEHEPDRSGRDAKGRFQKGMSGNPNGRKVQFPRDPSLPASRRRAIMEIADTVVEVKIDGQPRRMSLFEANVHALGVAGARGNRVASQKFVELMLRISETDLERRLVTQRMREHFDALEVENEKLRKVKGQDGPVVVLGPEEYERWNASRWLDDEESVAGMSPGRDSDYDRDTGAGGDLQDPE